MDYEENETLEGFIGNSFSFSNFLTFMQNKTKIRQNIDWLS